jgi:hypothetical protein
MTIIVNILGAPSAGKSIAAMRTTCDLRVKGVSVEYCNEVAKSFVFEHRKKALTCQPYIYGKQLKNMESLMGEVDVIVTDSPLILSSYYNLRNCPGRYPAIFDTLVAEHWKALGGLTFFLHRAHAYDPIGRYQSEEEANEISLELLELGRKHMPVIEMLGDDEAPSKIAARVLTEIGLKSEIPTIRRL